MPLPNMLFVLSFFPERSFNLGATQDKDQYRSYRSQLLHSKEADYHSSLRHA